MSSGLWAQRGGNPLRWPLLCLLALAGQSVWLFALSAPQWPDPAVRSTSAPSWKWIADGDPARATISEWLQVASPALVALPNPAGFSRALAEHVLAVSPPLGHPPDIPYTLERLHRGASQSPAVYRPPGPAVEDRAADLPLRRTMQAESGLHPVDIPGHKVPFMLRWIVESTRPMDEVVWPINGPLHTATPWHAELVLVVDDSGLLRHVLLERGTGVEEINDILLRRIHTWRWAPGESEETLRLHLSYVGRSSSFREEE